MSEELKSAMVDDVNIIRAFTADQVMRPTGLSTRQLADWDRIGFFAPHSSSPWSEVRLYLWKRRVHWDDPVTGKPVGVVDGQYALLAIADVVAEIREECQRLNRRDPSEIGKVEQHRYVAHNAPVVAGTRVRVSTVRHFVEAGYSAAQIVAEFPALTETDVRAVIDQQNNGLAA